jgi:hypothetical protein
MLPIHAPSCSEFDLRVFAARAAAATRRSTAHAATK